MQALRPLAGPPDHMALQASARRFRGIRAALGLTQRDWAYLLDVTINTVSAWENGKARPSRLAEAQIRNVAAMQGLDLHTLQAFK